MTELKRLDELLKSAYVVSDFSQIYWKLDTINYFTHILFFLLNQDKTHHNDINF